MRLVGTSSNVNGVGARLELHGSWGMQIREVRAGESYGITCSLNKYFGLGSADSIDKLVVKWPSGTVDEVLNPTPNELLTLTEGTFPSGQSSLLGDVNLSGSVDFLDIVPFVAVLSDERFQSEADCNRDGIVDFLDISPFVAILSEP